MNKFLVVFTTTTAMVLLVCSNVSSEIDFTLPVYADFTLQLPTSGGLPLDLDVVASPVESLQAKSKRKLSNTLTDIKAEQMNKICPLKISPKPLDNNAGTAFPPVVIIDVGGSDTIVEGASVSIKFAELNCPGSPFWQVVDGTVQTGDTLEKDKFKIIKVVDAGINTGPVYKIQSCPTNIDSSCQDLGLSVDPVTASTIVTTTQNPETSPLHVQIKPAK